MSYVRERHQLVKARLRVVLEGTITFPVDPDSYDGDELFEMAKLNWEQYRDELTDEHCAVYEVSIVDGATGHEICRVEPEWD